ncbi:MAG: hypothetical protein V2I33_25945 [Kangiellaceae bacterium]|jgi:hypothetical protein|nr:hypothetical protein [Kangiellaceae bacterium]
MIRVNRPLILWGYHTNTTNPFKPLEQREAQEFPSMNPDINTYISVKINLEPVLELPTETEADYYPGFENANFLYQGS